MIVGGGKDDGRTLSSAGWMLNPLQIPAGYIQTRPRRSRARPPPQINVGCAQTLFYCAQPPVPRPPDLYKGGNSLEARNSINTPQLSSSRQLHSTRFSKRPRQNNFQSFLPPTNNFSKCLDAERAERVLESKCTLLLLLPALLTDDVFLRGLLD